MSAGIETYDVGFTIDESWHRHPNYTVTGAAITSDNVFDTFDFAIAPQPIYTVGSDGTPVWFNGKNALVREGGRAAGAGPLPLSAMGPNYVAHSYRDYFARLHALLTGEGATVETVGTLGNGAKAFMSVRLPAGYDTLDFPGWSETHSVMNFGDSVDGSSATRAVQSMNVVVCKNTFAAHLMGVPSLWSVRHTTNAKAELDRHLAAFASAIEQTTAIRAAVDRLCNAPFPEADFRELLTAPDMVGDPAAPGITARQRTGRTNRIADVMTRYRGDDIAGVRSTRWGALMAVQGWEQHTKTLRGEVTDRTSRNLDRVVFGSADRLTETASRRLLAGVAAN